MSFIDKSKGQIVWGPPTVNPKSKEAREVQVGDKVRGVTPKKIGHVSFKDGKLWRIVGVHPIEYRSKYGKEWCYAAKALVQTWNVWIGDYRYTYQEVIYKPDFKFNVNEVVLCRGRVGIITERHGGQCPWYKILLGKDDGTISEISFSYELEISKPSKTLLNSIVLSSLLKRDKSMSHKKRNVLPIRKKRGLWKGFGLTTLMISILFFLLGGTMMMTSFMIGMF